MAMNLFMFTFMNDLYLPECSNSEKLEHRILSQDTANCDKFTLKAEELKKKPRRRVALKGRRIAIRLKKQINSLFADEDIESKFNRGGLIMVAL